jgi:hypothetical protein
MLAAAGHASTLTFAQADTTDTSTTLSKSQSETTTPAGGGSDPNITQTNKSDPASAGAPAGTSTNFGTPHQTGGPETVPMPKTVLPKMPVPDVGSIWTSLISMVVSALAGICAGVAFHYLYATSKVEAAEEDIAKALVLESIDLDEVGTEIRKLNRDFTGMVKDLNSAHEKDTADLRARLELSEAKNRQQQSLSPDQLRARAIVTCIDDAVQAFAAGVANADIRLLDETIGMRAALEATRTLLENLATSSDFSNQLLAALDHGKLDHGLTTASLLDTYFADRVAFRHIRVAYRSLESLLISLLHGQDVYIQQPSLLSIISTADVPNLQAADQRNVRNIPLIRQTAARVARGLEPNEVLIVDCPAPGWSSTRPIGRRQPRIAIFESSSWT